MPVRRVRGSRRRDVLYHLGEGRGTGGCPKTNFSGAKVNVVGKVEPRIGGERGAPLFDTLHHPHEVRRVGAHTILELSKVTLKETDLML